MRRIEQNKCENKWNTALSAEMAKTNGTGRIARNVNNTEYVAQSKLRYIDMSSMNIKPITLERILQAGNLAEAARRVVRNKGGAGVDGMNVDELYAYVYSHPHEISESVRKGSYRPSPIKRVYIPKDNGEKRPLGIPTVIDRFIQQAVALVLSEEYEKIFSDNSFGFRPGRGCQSAIERALQYVNEGYDWIIDLDLSKFFDTVNHSKLLQLLSDRIEDGRVISLIHRFLRAPVSENGKVGKKSTIGTPQGGTISPILANIILNELDQLLDERGIRFVRYADDMVIFCGSEKAAERILRNVTTFVEKKLFLKVNTTKTKITRAGKDTQFLGFAFTTRVTKKRKLANPECKYFVTVHQKKRDNLIKSLRELLNRKAPGGIEKVKRKLQMKLRGWCNYFRGAIPVTWMHATDEWIRRRIRQIHWKQWKKPGKRYEEINRRLYGSVPFERFSFSSNRYWFLSRCDILQRALKNKTLAQEGWVWLGTFER